MSECLIDFGQGHDAKFSDYIPSMIPENGIGIMDGGFASWELLDALSQTNTLFVVRIKNNMRTAFNHGRYRVVWFCDVESRTEFLPAEEFSNEEIGDIYGCRWQIELLWKFVKMQVIMKSRNGVTLVGYMILQLMEIPAFYGNKLLDKLGYVQLALRQRFSVMHSGYDFLPEALVP
jgi:putative transposase